VGSASKDLPTAFPLVFSNDEPEDATAGEDSQSDVSRIKPRETKDEPDANHELERAPAPVNPIIAKSRAKMARANFDKGMLYRQSGDSSRALIEFLKATREDPKLIDAYYEQALIFREKGFHKLAVSRLEQALAIKPKYQKARLLLATLKLEQGKVSDAVEQLGESLGLPKASTALKPDEEPGEENKVLGIPPMILQSLHTGLPLPAVPEEKSKVVAEVPNEEQQSLHEEAKPASRPARKKRPANRRKIRELIARKYKTKDSKSAQQKNWIAKLFSWPETFKADATDNRVTYADEEADDLAPRAASNLKKEFREAIEEEDEPEARPEKKMLIAYNGDPGDTLDLLYGKPGKKRSDTDTGNAEKARSNWSKPELPTTVSDDEPRKSTQQSQERNESRRSETSRGEIQSANDESRQNESRAVKSSGKIPAQSSDEGKPYYLNARKADQLPEKKLIAAKPAGKPMPRIKPNPTIVEDEWTKLLRYLAENGTSSLKPGEAFMFSEDIGEAVLFLADGKRIRRVIAAPQDSQEVIKMRRPDVLLPKELFFNTSLLGKVVKDPPAPPPVTLPPAVRGIDAEMEHEVEMQTKKQSSPSSSPTPPQFKIEQIMENPTGFWNWSKRLLNL
jgi:tetratricopeptide (TPR) repeat protein